MQNEKSKIQQKCKKVGKKIIFFTNSGYVIAIIGGLDVSKALC